MFNPFGFAAPGPIRNGRKNGRASNKATKKSVSNLKSELNDSNHNVDEVLKKIGYVEAFLDAQYKNYEPYDIFMMRQKMNLAQSHAANTNPWTHSAGDGSSLASSSTTLSTPTSSVPTTPKLSNPVANHFGPSASDLMRENQILKEKLEKLEKSIEVSNRAFHMFTPDFSITNVNKLFLFID